MKSLPKQIFITDSEKTDAISIAKKLPKNSAIILRDYDLPFEERFALGKELKKICLRKKIKLIIARDFDLALKLKADGIHFPEYLQNNIRRTRFLKPGWIILAAAHSRQAAINSLNNGADAILLSPIYKTTSHLGQKPLGPFRAKAVIRNQSTKTYGLGGITLRRAKTLESLGFLGFAGISAF